MSNPGYLYVLVNSSMPGLVKIGKTNRSPTDRAGELSGVTGVPTPFLVAFEQFFEDCDTAEDFAHTALERMGYRMSPNREFFNAPVNTVIRIIMQTPGQANYGGISLESTSDDQLLRQYDDDLNAIQLESHKHVNPWDDVLLEGDLYNYGTGGKIEDHQEALRLYKQAAKLGSSIAYQRIGGIYQYGEGVRQDKNKALQYYKEGARRGNY